MSDFQPQTELSILDARASICPTCEAEEKN
jgi:hypothetical protein